MAQPLAPGAPESKDLARTASPTPSNGSPADASPPPSTNPAPTSHGWHRPALLALAVAASLLGFLHTTHTPTTELPQSYALCSREKKVWTVDEQRPRVECVGVSSASIFATGDLRASAFGRRSMLG